MARSFGTAELLFLLEAIPSTLLLSLGALDFDHMSSSTIDSRAHRDQHSRQILHLRLTRSIFDHGAALGSHRRHHDILSRADRRIIEPYACALQPLSMSLYITIT